MANYDISSNSDLKSAVRGETLYADKSDELPDTDLEQIIDNTKMLVHAKTGSDKWFSDRGMGLVLFGFTCAKAKAAVENMTVQSISLQPISIEARDSNGNEVQFDQYEEHISTGMGATNVSLTRSSPTLSVSNDYIRSDPTPNS